MSTLRNIVFAALFAAAAFAASHAGAATKADPQSIARGRYIAQIAGCNDCHTAKYLLSNGKVPEKDWLMGDIVGGSDYGATAGSPAACLRPGGRWSSERQERAMEPMAASSLPIGPEPDACGGG